MKKNKIIIFLVLFLILLGVVIILNNPQDNKKAIFEIFKKDIVNIEDINLKVKNEKYKKVTDISKVGNGFFINSNGDFLTNKHVLNNNLSLSFIRIENKDYNFEIIKNYKEKDLIIGNIKNYKNKYYIKINKKININKSDEIFIYKKNILNKGKIINTNIDIEKYNLKNLFEIDIEQIPGDSGTPIFNKNNDFIGISTLINTQKNTSFGQIIN